MTLRSRITTGSVRVALRFANRALHDRIAAACTDIGVLVAAPDGADDVACIVLADHPLETASPTIIIGAGSEVGIGRGDVHTPWNGADSADIRAIVPDHIKPEVLGAVIKVVAAGLVVLPRPPVGFADMGEAEPARGLMEMKDAGTEGLPVALSARENEVLALLCEGASNKTIARALGLSVHTVKFHVASLNDKLGAKNRFEAITIAVRSGLVMV